MLPITVADRHGAYGTRWSSRFEAVLDTEFSYPLAPFAFAGCDVFSPSSFPCSDPVVLVKGRLLHLAFAPTGPDDTEGQFIYIQRGVGGNVSLSLKLIAETTNGTSDIVEIPIPRERDFRSSAFSIMDVPAPSADRRLALRIYGNDPVAGGLVRVRVLEGYPVERVIRDDVYTLGVVQRYYTRFESPLPLRPPIAVAFFNAAFDSTGQPLRFEIMPISPALQVWAFVSTTNNVSQHVEIFTPQ